MFLVNYAMLYGCRAIHYYNFNRLNVYQFHQVPPEKFVIRATTSTSVQLKLIIE